MNDYDCEFHYHPSKDNKVADALSQKTVLFAITVEKMLVQLQKDMWSLEMEVVVRKLLSFTIQRTIMEAIKRG